jgi:hypothetical protein
MTGNKSMQLTGNLLILGDSFCRDSEYWPTYFANHILGTNSQFRCLGYGGASWWFLRDKLLQLISHDPNFWNNTELLVMIHPPRCRIHTTLDDVRSKTFDPPLPRVFNNSDYEELDIAVKLYYKYFYSYEYFDWAEQQWFKELSAISKNKQVINMFVDIEGPSAPELLPGITVDQSLIELGHSQYRHTQDITPTDGVIGFQNHFTPNNNRIFASQLYEIAQSINKKFNPEEFEKYGR